MTLTALDREIAGVVRSSSCSGCGEEAVAAGVSVVEPIDLAEVAAVQPLQRKRRETLLGRTLAAGLAGRRPPRDRGFGLLRLAMRRLVETLRPALGTCTRVPRGSGPTPSPSR